ncbi:hypothetical protein [uncultured Bacteroides sp.]|uniref:hypothetical protein n=1 Tax=uncultured Bacteroides sp. TaxID=162156 RepID=UPI0025F5EF81|nr:hypothetical protein [uncultured Bacteroides sp.]
MERNNRKDRNTLKEYFRKGKTPTEEQFAQLIDSMSNLVEDRQIVRTDTGWAFYPSQAGSMNIGLYMEENKPPVWTFSITSEKHLLIKNEKGETVFDAAQDKLIVLPGSLTVEGSGEKPVPGGEDYLSVPADKQWHDLPLDVSSEGFGCRVYLIYASFREQGTGLCKLTRVTAIWLNRMEQRIESPQKHWWGWAGGIRFRWLDTKSKPCLQMCSKKYLPSGEVHCRIVKIYKG